MSVVKPVIPLLPPVYVCMPTKIVTKAQASACDRMEKYTPLMRFLKVEKPTSRASRSGSTMTARKANGADANGFQNAGSCVRPPVTMNSGSELPLATSFRCMAMA